MVPLRLTSGRQEEQRTERQHVLVFYTMNVCLSGHWFSLVKSIFLMVDNGGCASCLLDRGGSRRFWPSPHFKKCCLLLSALWTPLAETLGRTPTQPGTEREDTLSSSSSQKKKGWFLFMTFKFFRKRILIIILIMWKEWKTRSDQQKHVFIN